MSQSRLQQHPELKVLLITGLIVLLIGAPAAYSLVQDSSSSVIVLENGDRAPASIRDADELAEKTQGAAKSITLNLDCQETFLREVVGTHVRIKGHVCTKEKVTNVSVVNSSNGFTAAVIFTKGNEFTTDFIDLQDGQNNLIVSALDSRGETISRPLTIHRMGHLAAARN